VIGHPFNPSAIIRWSKSSGAAKTSPDAIQQAMKFYASIGKKPIHLRKETSRSVANRLQAALYREVAYLIEQDVLSVADADDAVSWDLDFVGASWPQFAVAHWWWRRRDPTFHATSHGPAGCDVQSPWNPEMTPDLNERSPKVSCRRPQIVL